VNCVGLAGMFLFCRLQRRNLTGKFLQKYRLNCFGEDGYPRGREWDRVATVRISTF